MISILFYSILLYFKLIRFDFILFFSLLLNSIYCIVQYSISYQWMICVCLSVRASVHLSVYLSVWISLCFLFSPVSCFFSSHFLFLYTLFLLSFLMNVFLTHTHTRTRTHTYIWIYVPSYDSYILLQKRVSEESYSSDSIISYLI